MPDPRPDLVEDSELWGRLLNLALSRQVDETVYQALHGMRCCGLRLEPGERGGYVLRPLIEESGRSWWWTREDYERDRERWLVPHKVAIVRLLAALDSCDEM